MKQKEHEKGGNEKKLKTELYLGRREFLLENLGFHNTVSERENLLVYERERERGLIFGGPTMEDDDALLFMNARAEACTPRLRLLLFIK